MKKNNDFIPNDEQLLRVEKKFDDTTLAMEIFSEYKRANERLHKIVAYLILIIVILIIALVGTNIGWFIYESQFETITETEETTQTIEDVDNAQNTTFSQTIN